MASYMHTTQASQKKKSFRLNYENIDKEEQFQIF